MSNIEHSAKSSSAKPLGASPASTPTHTDKSPTPASEKKAGATPQKSQEESSEAKVRALSVVEFSQLARVPGYNGAYQRAVRGPNPNSGVPTQTFYTEKLALWGNVIIVGEYYMPLTGIVAGYMYAK
jgi:hypothetical protein